MKIDTNALKRRSAALLAAVVTLMCLLPLTATVSFAEGESDAAASYYVIDGAGSLEKDQVTILDTRCKWLENQGMRLIIATEFEPAAQADQEIDTYESRLDDGNGLILYADLETKEIKFRAYGTAQYDFDEKTCSSLEEILQSRLESDDFYKACCTAVYNVDNISNGYGLSDPDFYNPAVTDSADYLTDDQIEELSKKLDALREKYGFDVSICIDAEQWGDSAEAAADDTYDYYFYGGGTEQDGILLYISKEPRSYHMSTFGYALTVFNDRGIAYMKSIIVPELKNDDYYAACTAYADGAAELLQMAADGNPYNKRVFDAAKMRQSVIMGVIIALLLALIVARLTNKRKTAEMNTAREKADAHGYMRPGSFNLAMSQDVFLYSRTDRIKIQKESSSGSSTHISSSGRSHGGGGGSY